MPFAFISYRRNDTSGRADGLATALAKELGRKRVFLDKSSIEPGKHFERVISAALDRASILIVLIGPNTFPKAGDVHEAMDDYVRTEIRIALDRQIPVLPVLIGNAVMPREEQFPADIRKISKLHAIPVPDDDVEGATQNIARKVWSTATLPRLRLLIVHKLATAAAIILVAGTMLLSFRAGYLPRPTSPSSGKPVDHSPTPSVNPPSDPKPNPEIPRPSAKVVPLRCKTPDSSQATAMGLAGDYKGYRPTNGYIWEIRYQLQFRSDGSYSYLANQVSAFKRFWKLQNTGCYEVLPSEASGWSWTLALTPQQGSPDPPTDEDRSALVDNLGLPDNRPRKFRARLQKYGAFELQLTDADPSDGITQTWYFERASKKL